MRAFSWLLILGWVVNGLDMPSACASPAQDRLITARSVGAVRLGMTVSAAKKALTGYKLERTRDGEGLALIAVTHGKTTIMVLFAGEDDAGAPINPKAHIEDIQVLDSGYSTNDGVHPGMLLSDVEKRYGKLKELLISEIEQREFATFSKQPVEMIFRVHGTTGAAGKYTDEDLRRGPPMKSRKYMPSARILSINISKPHRRG